MNRPLMSFSHSSAGMRCRTLIGTGPPRAAPFSRWSRGGSCPGHSAGALAVRNIDQGIGEYLTQKDLLYFRRLSPLGLFECYSPKLKALFWILPENVRPCGISQDACHSSFATRLVLNMRCLGLQPSVQQPVLAALADRAFSVTFRHHTGDITGSCV